MNERFQYIGVVERDSAGGGSAHALGSIIQIFNGNVNAALSRDDFLRQFGGPSMCRHLPMSISLRDNAPEHKGCLNKNFCEQMT